MCQLSLEDCAVKFEMVDLTYWLLMTTVTTGFVAAIINIYW